ncbi:Ig-like domain-containing protein [Clostridium sp. DL1XJH146]
MAVQTVKAVINGSTYDLSYNSTSGKWEATITAPAISSYNNNVGHYYPVEIQAADQAGNSTIKDDTDGTLGSKLKLYVKETVKPTISSLSPSSGAKLTNSSPTITFSLRDETNGSGVKISSLVFKIDGGETISNDSAGMVCTSVSNGYDCTYTCQSALSEGGHTITISVQDNDGNLSSTSSTSFTIDTVPPVLNITNPTNGLITNNASLAVSGTTNDVTSSPVTVTIKLNGVDQGTVSVASGNFSKSITLSQGSNTIVIRSTDGSGKYSEITRTVTLDTTPPNITAVTLTPQTTNTGTTFVIQVTVSD